MQKSQSRNGHLALLGAAHSLNHSLFVIAPPLLTLIMSDLGTSNLTIGTAVAVASFMYGLGALAGGPLGDKIGEAKTIAASLALSGLSTLVMLAAGATQSIYLFATALVSMGVWASFYHPTANSLISKIYAGKVAESMGLHGVGGTLGVVLTPTIAYAIGITAGWPYAFITFGLLCLLLAIPFAKNSIKEENKNNKQGSILEALRIRELRVLLVLNVVIGLFMKSIELYFPTYLKDNRMIDGWWASVAFTLVLAVGVAGQWLGGRASDAVGSKKVLVATMAGITLGLASLLLMPIYVVGIVLFIVLYGMCFYAHQPALNYLTGLLSPECHRGVVYGMFFFTSFGIGSLSQVMAGYVADVYGLDASFTLLTAFALTALILSLKLPDKREGKQMNAI